MALLAELLTEEENNEFNGFPFRYPTGITKKDFKLLTVDDLSKIGLFLINSEYGNIPDCTISAEAINILNNRALKLQLALF